jgi:D-ribose pyranose/furanose isomerase RbsD
MEINVDSPIMRPTSSGIPIPASVKSKLIDIGWMTFSVALPSLIELLILWLKEIRVQKSEIPSGIKSTTGKPFPL